MGGVAAKETMPYPVGGIPCAATVTKFQFKTDKEEFIKKLALSVQDIVPTLEGALSPTMAIQFPHPEANDVNEATVIACYESKAHADGNIDKVKAGWADMKDDLVGEPVRMVVEGACFPIAKFPFDDPLSLIPVGMSFGTYPLKGDVTLQDFKKCFSSECMAMLRNEFGLLWMWVGVSGSMGIISTVYSCEEACAAPAPKIGKVMKQMGALDLMDGSPYLRVVGPGFMVKKTNA